MPPRRAATFCATSRGAGRRLSRKMIEATEGHAVILMVGQVLRFWPDYCQIKELIARGALGDIQSISAYRLSKFPTLELLVCRSSEEWRMLARSSGARCRFHSLALGPPEQVRHTASARRRGAGDHVWTTSVSRMRCARRSKLSHASHRGRFLPEFGSKAPKVY